MYYIVSLDIMSTNTLGNAEAYPFQDYRETWSLSAYVKRDHSIPDVNSILQVGSGLDTSVSVLVEIPDGWHEDDRRACLSAAFKRGKDLILKYLNGKPPTYFKSDL
jgi:hypothetical protein